MCSPTHLALDQARSLEHLDVLGGGGERHCERLGKLTYRAFSVRKVMDHPSARGIAKGVEDLVQLGRV